MKNIIFTLLSFMVFSSFTSIPTEETPALTASTSYVILKNGEKIENISNEQSEIFHKTGKLVIEGRIIESQNMLWVRDTKGLWLMYNNYKYKCAIEGKVCVYRSATTFTKENGLVIYAPKYFILAEGETDLNNRLTYENLVKAISDNPEALAKAKKVHKRLINRDLVTAQLKIVEFFNEQVALQQLALNN